MTTPSRELTPEQIAPALAEAQGWVLRENMAGTYNWYDGCTLKCYEEAYDPIDDAYQFNLITLDPEIHTGMIDVLDEWLIEQEYWHNPEYLQDIRLWQLRACVEFLRRRGK